MNGIGVAELEARLSHYLRQVRAGVTITIMDRGTAVARLVPHERDEPLEIRRATRAPTDLELPPRPAAGKNRKDRENREAATDSLAALLADRGVR